jgi:Domain of unknown function (DUF397)
MDVTWRKSSHSGGNGGGCIEAGQQPGRDRVLVRDTKDRTGPVLSFAARDWRRFTSQLKAADHRH